MSAINDMELLQACRDRARRIGQTLRSQEADLSRAAAVDPAVQQEGVQKLRNAANAIETLRDRLDARLNSAARKNDLERSGGV